MDIDLAKRQAKVKALDSLSRYKFIMFGYHAALWVTLNKLQGSPHHNPFSALVNLAKAMNKED